MRSGINSLSVKVSLDFGEDDCTGLLFLFCGRNRRSIKILEFTEDGVWLYQKRLECGRFKWLKSDGTSTVRMDEDQLRSLLEGIPSARKKTFVPKRKLIRF